MKKLKKIALVFLFVFVGIFAVGCSQVTLSTTIRSDGAITCLLKMDIKDVNNQSGVRNLIQGYYNQLENAYKDNLIDLYSNVYSSQSFNFDEMSKEDKYSFVVNKNSKFYIDDITNLSSTITSANGIIVVQKYFSSIYAYLMYFNPQAFCYDVETESVKLTKEYSSLVDVPINSTMQTEENLFFTKYLQKCKPFSYNNNEPELLADLVISGTTYHKGDTLVEVLCDLTGATEEQTKLYFNFSTPYRRLHSDGTITMSSYSYTHSWELTSVNDEVSVWRNYAKPGFWYIIGLLATILGFVVALAVIILTKNKKKKIGLEALVKITQLTNSREDKDVKEKEN